MKTNTPNSSRTGRGSDFSASTKGSDFSRKMITLSGRRSGLPPFHTRSLGSWKGLQGLKVYVDAPEAEPLKKRGRPRKKVVA